MQVDPFEFDEFGELAFLIGNAIKIDLGVLSLYCAPYTQPMLDNFLNICRYRVNTPVEMINLAGCDLTISADDLMCKYLTVPSEYILSEIVPTVEYAQEKIFAGLVQSSMNSLGAAVIKSLREGI